MAVYRPSELVELLKSLGVSPKKRFSQNFLIDGNVLDKITKFSGLEKDDVVVEIGAGPGALTEKLLEKGAHVIAIEKDPVWAEALKRLQNENLTIIEDDALLVDYRKLLPSQKKAKVIANLPYHITTPILAKLITVRQFSSLTVMVQEEVAKRFTGKPGTKDYGSISIFLNFYTRPEYGFKVKKSSFYPAPKVDSAVVSLELKETLPLEDSTFFFKIVRESFNHRRKMLRGSLTAFFPAKTIEEALMRSELKAEARPEDLSLDQFLTLYKNLAQD